MNIHQHSDRAKFCLLLTTIMYRSEAKIERTTGSFLKKSFRRGLLRQENQRLRKEIQQLREGSYDFVELRGEIQKLKKEV